MKIIKKSITINVPVNRAYKQWTRFEDFPRFMEAVKEVKRLENNRLRWKAEIAGKTEEWDAEIVEEVPGEEMGWRSLSGARNLGWILFCSVGANQTKLDLRLAYQPKGVVENLGDVLGVVSARVSSDLRRFKEFVETQPPSTGDGHGEIPDSVKDNL
jgi:uncharacterized membrane protein